jgi:hypothetical protein
MCPSGTQATTVSVSSDCAGYATTVQSSISFCEPAAPASGWFGAYQAVGASCLVPNRYSSSCACPAASSALALDTFLPITGYPDTNIVLCVSSAFPGAYELDDAVQGDPITCRTPNPITGSCSCAGGSTAYRVEVNVPTAGSGRIGAHIYICN